MGCIVIMVVFIGNIVLFTTKVLMYTYIRSFVAYIEFRVRLQGRLIPFVALDIFFMLGKNYVTDENHQ